MAIQDRLLAIVGFACLSVPANVAGDVEQRPEATTGTVAGIVTYTGEVPKSRLRDEGGQRRELLTVQRRSSGVRDVLVYLELDGARDPDVDKPVESAAIVVDQVEYAFRPHLIAIRDGQKVKFTNNDAANHNVRAISFVSQNEFNVITGVAGQYVHQFVAGKKLRPISLKCDLHPWMQGWIYVLKHPHFAVSDERGKFQLRCVPIGTHRLAVWQPDVGYRKTFDIAVTAEQTTSVDIKITQKDLRVP